MIANAGRPLAMSILTVLYLSDAALARHADRFVGQIRRQPLALKKSSAVRYTRRGIGLWLGRIARVLDVGLAIVSDVPVPPW